MFSILWGKSDKKDSALPSKTPPSEDDKNRIDFVLVLKKIVLKDEVPKQLATYLFNVQKQGFNVEIDYFSLNDSIMLIKIYAPQEVLVQTAEIFGIDLEFQSLNVKIPPPKPWKFTGNELTLGLTNTPVYQRARAAFANFPVTDLTSAEKGLLIYKALSLINFDEDPNDIGIDKLLRKGIFDSAYPVHDGPYQWSETGPLNDRQLLAKYWSSFKCWYQQQPLNLIEKYYGPEPAFYFAWLGLYNRMLFFATLFCIPCVILGGFMFLTSLEQRRKEVCDSDKILCPKCLVENCRYYELKHSCFQSYLSYIFDNPLIVIYAALMSLWSFIFLELWKREEALLQLRWNLGSYERDYSIRPDYSERADYEKKSQILGTMEPQMSKKQNCCRYIISGSVIMLMIIIMILIILSVLVYIKTVNIIVTMSTKNEFLIKYATIVGSCTGSGISLIVCLLFTLVYRKIALELTILENPRTQVEFDNSYIYKSFILAFVIYYSVIFYLVFLKARFYTYPGDQKIFTTMAGLGSDLCDPTGCYFDICVQLIGVLFAKKLCSTTVQYILPLLRIFAHKQIHVKKNKVSSLSSQYEKDFMLNPMIKYYFMDEYIQMIIQYGFVTFFIAAFPLTPVLALLNNLIELRVDATKLTSTFKRPIAYKVANIGAWNGILRAVTFIGIFTNAFVIAFRSEMVEREIYRYNNGDLAGFVNSTLSIFNTSDFPSSFRPNMNVSLCYYPGNRFPPDHPNKYQLTDDFWYQITIKLLVIIAFEHVVVIVAKMVSHSIPKVPSTVKEYLRYYDQQIKEMKMKEIKEKYLKQQ